MERKAKLVCSVVGFIGLLSAVLSFAAEATRTPAFQTTSETCLNSPAPGLGFAAAVFLLTAQITVCATTGCCGCCRQGYSQSNSSSTLAVICFVFSWIAFLIAFLMILIAAALSASNQGGEGGDNPDCSVLQPGVFAGAAVLSLANVVLGIVYYLILDSAKIRNDSCGGTPVAPNESGIAMAQPKFPPPQFPPPQFPPPQVPPPQFPSPQVPPSAPVFVHEDTYTCFCLVCQHRRNVSQPE